MRGLIHGTMHLSIGQEASAVGATLPLARDDYILSTHRGHGHCIAKGADPARMFAEFFGKENGYCRGRGGSMHIADVEGGNLGANGIVAGGLPIAVGVGMSIKAQKQDRVCMVFFGDGATNEGAFHESLNMASIWKLPVVFVCENNKYGMSMDIARAMAVANVADRAPAYAMPGIAVDGNDLPAVAAAARAGDRARAARRRSDAARVQDLSAARPLQERSQPLSHQGGDRGLARRAIRSAASSASWSRTAASPRPNCARSSRRRSKTIDDALEFAKASPDPDPRAADARRLCRLSLPSPEAGTRELSLRRGDPRRPGAGDGGRRARVPVRRGRRRLRRRVRRLRRPVPPLRRRARDRYADQRARDRRRRGRRGAHRHAAGARAPVLGFRHAGDGADRQPGGEDPLHVRRQGQRCRWSCGCPAARAPARPRSTARASRRGSRTCPASRSCSRRRRTTPRACCSRRSTIPNPVLIFEHKLLYKTKGPVPEEPYRVPIGKAAVRRAGPRPDDRRHARSWRSAPLAAAERARRRGHRRRGHRPALAAPDRSRRRSPRACARRTGC